MAENKGESKTSVNQQSQGSNLGTVQMGTIIKLSIGVFIALIVLVFIFQNLDKTEIEFFWGRFYIPKALIIFGSAIAGALIVGFGLVAKKYILDKNKTKQIEKK